MYQRFQRYHRYDIESNEKTLESLRSIPDPSHADARRAIDLFAHMQAARQLWLSRMDPAIQTPEDIFPANVSLDRAETWFRSMNDAWTPFERDLSDAKLRQVVDYKAFDGGRFHSRIEDILTQLFGHGWYHRGQIAMLVRRAAGKPATTDWIYSTREPID